MTRMVGRARAALLVFGTALLALLAPGVALAHDSGAAHHADAAQTGSHNVGDAGFAAPCPGGSGHVCGCGSLDALAQGSAPAAAAFSRPIIGTTLRERAKRSTAVASARSLLSLSSARPRAPPQAT